MIDRRTRLLRIYEVTDIIWRQHMRQLTSYESELQTNIRDENNVLAKLGGDIPITLLMSRLNFLRARRNLISEQINIETLKAQQAGFRLKRIDRRLKKAD